MKRKTKKAIVLKKWVTYGHQGKKAGYRCIVKCQQCGNEREMPYGHIKFGKGKFCSTIVIMQQNIIIGY